jgi:hypothetical protein
VPALSPILQGAERPSWLSAPVAVVSDAVTDPIATTQPAFGVKTVGAVYAVCFDPVDTRCQP